MKTISPNPVYFGSLRRAFRVQVHQLIAWGHEDTRAKMGRTDDEPAITGYIAEAIADRLRVPNGPGWSVHYFIKDDPPVRSEGRSGRSRPRADVIIEANLWGRPEYVFEAKRLQGHAHGTDRYVGSEGMGCFVSGLYASRYDEAAMLGYVQSESVPHWRAKIKQAIDNGEAALRLRVPQRDETVIDAFPLEWVSEHDRQSVGRPVAIYHLLLDCCADAVAASAASHVS